MAVQYDYDERDRVRAVIEGRVPATDANGTGKAIRRSTFAYDGFGNVTKQVTGELLSSPGATDPEKQFERTQQTDSQYDALGRLRTVTEWIGPTNAVFSNARVTEYKYTAAGEIEYATVRPLVFPVVNDPNKSEAENKADNEQIQFDLTRVTKFVYNRLGNQTKVYAAWAEDQNKVLLNLTSQDFPGDRYGSPVTEFAYDAAGRVLSVTDPRGVESTTVYDELGRKSAETLGSKQGNANPSSFVKLERAFEYDLADRLVAVVAGNKSLWIVDGDTTTLGSARTEYEYDLLDRKIALIEGAGSKRERHTLTEYAGATDLVAKVTTGVSPYATIKTVDGKDIQYSRPVSTSYTYDPLGRLVRVDEGTHLTAEQYAEAKLGHTRPWTETEYDASGHVLLTRTNVSNGTTDRISITRVLYDKLGRVAQTNEGEGVGANGERIQAEQRVTALLLDSLDAVKYQLTLGQPWVGFEYDRLGNLTKQTKGVQDPRKLADAKALETDTAVTNGRLYTVYKRNVFGEVTEQTDQTGAGGRVENEYDLLGRVRTQYRKAGEQRLESEYDASGNLLSVRDVVNPTWYEVVKGQKQVAFRADVTRSSTTYYTYDALNRKTSETDPYWSAASPTGHTTYYRYDALGRVEAVQARDGKIRWFGYDSVGRQVLESWGAGAALADNLVPTVPNQKYFENATVVATYTDAADRVAYTFQAQTKLEVRVEDGRFPFAAPVTGANWTLKQFTDTAFTFDALGRVRQEITDAGGFTLTYGYDAAGRTVRVSDATDSWQTTEYDLAGRVVARTLNTSGKGTHYTFKYKEAATYRTDLLKYTFGHIGPSAKSSVRIYGTIDYDHLGREVRREWIDTPFIDETVVSLEGVSTVYDQTTGLIQSEGRYGRHQDYTKEPITTTFEYDFNQVLRESKFFRGRAEPVKGESIPRDAAGNSPYSSEPEAKKTGYRVTSAGSSHQWGYDGQWNPSETSTVDGTLGNVTKLRSVRDKGFLDIYTFEYDGRNRLVAVVRQNPPEAQKNGPDYRVEYVYDTLDRLVARHYIPVGEPRVLERYVTAQGQEYADLNENGSVRTRYLDGIEGEPLAMVQISDLPAGTDKQPFFYLTDRQNSVLQLTDATGEPIKRVVYSGLTAKQQPPKPDAPLWAKHDNFGLGGERVDLTTGLTRINGQWYHPEIGRTLTEGGPGLGLNPYPVAENSVPNKLHVPKDDTGLTWIERQLGSLWADPEMYFRGVGNGLTFGGTEWVGRNLFGTDPSKWNSLERTVFGNGDTVGTVAGVFLGYGAVIRGAGALGNAVKLSQGGTTALVAGVGGAVNLAGYRLQTSLTGQQRTVGGGFGAFFGGVFGGAAGALFRTTSFGGMALAGGATGLGGGLVSNSIQQWMDPEGFSLRSFLHACASGFFGGALGGGLFKMFGGRMGFGSGSPGSTPLAMQCQTAPELVRRFTAWQFAVGGVGGMAGDAIGQGLGMALGLPGSENGFDWGQMFASGLGGGFGGDASYRAMRAGMKVCFAAGTPLRTPEGWRYIEDLRAGDLVLSRDEHDADGPVEAKVVEEVFVREGLVTHLMVNGQVIRTTFEHPFFVWNRGWVPCGELQVGDRIATESGAWVAVEGVEHTGVWAPVYNIRVADYHTYFVGCDEWGFSVWAHNSYDDVAVKLHNEGILHQDAPGHAQLRQLYDRVALAHGETAAEQAVRASLAETARLHGVFQRAHDPVDITDHLQERIGDLRGLHENWDVRDVYDAANGSYRTRGEVCT